MQRLKEVCFAFANQKGQLMGNFFVTKVSYGPPTITSLSNSTPEPVQSLCCQTVEPTEPTAEWLLGGTVARQPCDPECGLRADGLGRSG